MITLQWDHSLRVCSLSQSGMELAPLEHQARHNVDVSAKGIS
jgi:hypothetical protein